MKETSFRKWLESYGYNGRTIQNRLSNVKHVEEYYNHLDSRIENGNIDRVLSDMSYTTDDERNQRKPRHLIPVNGNIRAGTATLKQALNLYIQFYRDTYTLKASTRFEELKNQLRKAVDDFLPEARHKSYSGEDVKHLIQEPLLNYLESNFGHIDWSMEQLMDLNSEHRDRADIMGLVDDNHVVIVEIDTYRADQVGKKYVSRMALLADKNVIYICLCYPNRNANARAGEKETNKYWEYMETVTNMLAQSTSLEKYFINSSI